MKRAHLFIALFGILGSNSLQAQQPTTERRPNVVLILADDLGIGDVSAYRSNHIPTPNIDRLGKSGVRFTDAHVSAAVCMPSRAGLITGRQGTRHGSEFNAGPGLSLSEQNIAELLKTNGYKTAAFGKWHLGTTEGRDPLSQGFDEFFGVTGGGTTFIDPLSPDAINGYGVPIPNGDPTRAVARDVSRGREKVEEKEYLTDALTREAVDYIGRKKQSPFFLYLAYNAPHSPHQTIRKYYDRFEKIKDHSSRVYAAMVSAVDDGVGAVVKKLQDEGLEKDTLLIFLSDNGGPDYFKGGPNNANFAGWKRYHLEGGHRVPFFISWPTKIAGDRVDTRLTSSLDLFPTIAAATGTEVAKERTLDGVNLIPFLNGERQDAPHQNLFWRASANFAVREGKWKLLVVNKTKAEQFLEVDKSEGAGLLREGPYNGVSPLGQHTVLCDLEADSSEQKNVASDHPEIVERLKQKYLEWNRGNVSPNAKSSRGIPTVIDGVVVQLAF